MLLLSLAPLLMTQAMGKRRETCPASDVSTEQTSNPKTHGQSQDVETVTDLYNTDSPKQTSESNTDIETANEPMQIQRRGRVTLLRRLKLTNLLLRKSAK